MIREFHKIWQEREDDVLANLFKNKIRSNTCYRNRGANFVYILGPIM
jgi:hypothetical protein